MIHKNPAPCKRILSFPIPLNCQHLFTGPQADDLAKFSYLLLIYSLAYEERRDFNFYIPFPYSTGYRYFGDRWNSLKKLTQTEYGEVFEWNTRYSNREVNAFSMSVRLSKAVRTGECVLYTTHKRGFWSKPCHIWLRWCILFRCPWWVLWRGFTLLLCFRLFFRFRNLCKEARLMIDW